MLLTKGTRRYGKKEEEERCLSTHISRECEVFRLSLPKTTHDVDVKRRRKESLTNQLELQFDTHEGTQQNRRDCTRIQKGREGGVSSLSFRANRIKTRNKNINLHHLLLTQEGKKIERNFSLSLFRDVTLSFDSGKVAGMILLERICFNTKKKSLHASKRKKREKGETRQKLRQEDDSN